MDLNDKNMTPEPELEDILREFGGGTEGESPTQSGVEAILREFADDPDAIVHIEDEPEAPADPIRPESAVTGDTIRMGAVKEAVAAALGGDTVRMAPVTEETLRMQPVSDETQRLSTADLPKGEVRIAQPIRDEEEKEAFSESWEPEYEQPMGSYTPPPPIIVHPRSRLRELKRQLVAGPERRYYELSEQGVGKLQAAIFFSVLVVLVSAAATVLYSLNLIPENRLRLMVFSQFFTMLLSAALASQQLVEGLSDLFRGRFSLNSLLVFSFAACCADGVLCLRELRVPCCAAFGLQVTMSLWSAYHKRSTEMAQMDTLRKAIHLNGIGACPDYHEGRKGFLPLEGQVPHFMDHYAKRSVPEIILGWYALFATVVSIGMGVSAYLVHGLSTGLQVTAVSLLASAPAVAFISQSRPRHILEHRLHKLGAMICGWRGVKGLCGKAVLPINHNDLFPAGTVKMNGVKFFGKRRPEEIVACAAALAEADRSGLAPLFRQVADSRNAPHFEATALTAYEQDGVGGKVRGEEVLLGSLQFLQEMGVELPEGIRVSHAVCVAISGELCGLFAVTHEKAKLAAAGLATVCSRSKLQPLVTVSDFAMHDSLLRPRFGKHAKKILYPDQATRAELREKQLPEDAASLLMTTKEGLAPVAYAITGARSLRAASIAGLVLSLLGGLLGLAMMELLVLLGALDLLTPANMLAFQLIWILPALLISGWTRIL